jgi:hypothetical protein
LWNGGELSRRSISCECEIRRRKQDKKDCDPVLMQLEGREKK